MHDTLTQVRKKIAEEGGSELVALKDHPAALAIWEELQILKAEKYKAVKDAISKTSKPFDEKISDIEKQYALLLRLAI